MRLCFFYEFPGWSVGMPPRFYMFDAGRAPSPPEEAAEASQEKAEMRCLKAWGATDFRSPPGAAILNGCTQKCPEIVVAIVPRSPPETEDHAD